MGEIISALKRARHGDDDRHLAAERNRSAAPTDSSADGGRPDATSRNGEDPAAGDLLVTAEDRTHVSEQFRVLRTRIELAGPGLYMLTSALDQEGKTLCAANLTIALSMGMESKVLVVDADLRHPSIGASFGVGERRGLVDCLNGRADWRDCIVDTRYRGVSILPAGRPSSLAPELLASRRMTATIDELKEEFRDHFLIIDAPPLLLTSDPLVLARHMDRILLVVRAGVTPRAAVTKAVEVLGSENIFGVIFNGAQETFSHHYYYGGRYPYANR